MNNTAKNNKMIITGISGLLGNNLAVYFRSKYEILGLYHNNPVSISGIRTELCDISNLDSVGKIVEEFAPSIIIHCASLTNVDECETNREFTREVNVVGTGNLVKSTTGKNIRLVYISTDSVYDGEKGDYSEIDSTNPLNYYGITKLLGEEEVAKHDSSIVLRTNIFGWNIQDKKSIGEWVLGELQAGRSINGFNDAYFSSVYTMELARIIDIAIQKNVRGIYNCGCVDSCSKYEFALKIADCFGYSRTLVSPVSIEKHSFAAKRGKKMSLNVQKLQTDLAYRLPTIDQSIEAFYRDYMSGVPGEIKNQPVNARDKKEAIPYGRQWIDENDIQAVVNVLRSDRLTQGPKVDEFERMLCHITGARYAVAVNSGTAALHIACLSAGVKTGDEVITSPNTFVASANSAAYCGAKPVFADISSDTYNITSEKIEEKITSSTKMIIPVHFAGQSCDMEAIQKLVRNQEQASGHKIYIVEDACHALGSVYKGQKVGSCTYSDMTVFSFHPVKHITTGEGGAVLTNDVELYERLRRFRTHGITNNPAEISYKEHAYQAPEAVEPQINPWYYEQLDLGYNYRITDIQCALGHSQLSKLDSYCRRRREIVDKYNEAFKDSLALTIPYESENCDSNFHLYVLLFDWQRIGVTRVQLISILRAKGIFTQVHYIPVYTQPYYRATFETQWGDCPDAEAYYDKCLSIPLYAGMTDDDVDMVIKGILGSIK